MMSEYLNGNSCLSYIQEFLPFQFCPNPLLYGSCCSVELELKFFFKDTILALPHKNLETTSK